MERTLTEKFYAKEELTVKEREEIRAGSIRVNAAKCKKCGDIICSDNRHDFKTCRCGNLSVDGGSWYAKRVFRDGEDSYENMIESYQDREE